MEIRDEIEIAIKESLEVVNKKDISDFIILMELSRIEDSRNELALVDSYKNITVAFDEYKKKVRNDT